jgi:hypothetical protein
LSKSSPKKPRPLFSCLNVCVLDNENIEEEAEVGLYLLLDFSRLFIDERLFSPESRAARVEALNSIVVGI